jgi:citrate synthase
MTAGLEGVIAAETCLSHVDGERGQLILRGLSLDEAVANPDLDVIAAHLWRGFVEPVDDLSDRLAAARQTAFPMVQWLLPELDGLSPIEAVRALTAALPDAPADDAAYRIAGALPVFVAAIGRQRAGLSPVPPNKNRSQTADLLAMLTGRDPSRQAVQALSTYLITAIDHGLNASTFTARVVASTKAGLVSTVTAALGALAGPLHGGAPGPVLDMFDAIGSPDRAEAWIDAALDRGERLMGFGHRIYRVRDPRADALKQQVERLGGERLAFAEAVEAAALAALERHKPDRPLKTNTEFYTAVLLNQLRIDRGLFTPVFACGRAFGWIAHAMEQQATGRLIRPQSRYIGPAPAAAV